VLCHRHAHADVLPANAVLPDHHGVVITRGFHEWASLLPLDLPIASVARLLGWHTQAAAVLSDTTVRTLVRQHGQLIRQAEPAEATTLLTQDRPASRPPVLVPPGQPRRRAGWPPALNAAVEPPWPLSKSARRPASPGPTGSGC
jgi:hypothetical protein